MTFSFYFRVEHSVIPPFLLPSLTSYICILTAGAEGRGGNEGASTKQLALYQSAPKVFQIPKRSTDR